MLWSDDDSPRGRDSRRKAKGLLVAVVCLVATSAWLASRDITAGILVHPSFLATTGRIALGPLIGWIVCVRSGHLAMGLLSLLPSTIFSVGPLALWMTRGHVFWLVVGTASWVASGYFFAVAIWV